MARNRKSGPEDRSETPRAEAEKTVPATQSGQSSEARAETEAGPEPYTGAPAADWPKLDPEEPAPAELAAVVSPGAETKAYSPSPSRPASAPARGGFLPALLGGVLAAGLGATGALYLYPEGWRPVAADDTALKAEIAALRAEMAPASGLASGLGEFAARLDMIEEEIAALRQAAPGSGENTAAEIAALRVEIAAAAAIEREAVAARIDAVEATLSALPEGAGGDAAAAMAFRRELEAMKAELAASQAASAASAGEVAAAAAAAGERIASAETEAKRLRDEATEAARQGAARAAASHLRAAFAAGTALDRAFAELDAAGVALPSGLRAAAETAPTRAALAASFPAAARAALSAALRAEAEGAGAMQRLGAFLRSQTGARSLEPREGADADAVLSRAEAALGRADLAAALDELALLPDPAGAAMAGWIASATARLDAARAIEALDVALD